MYHIYVYDELMQDFITYGKQDSLDEALVFIDQLEAPACVTSSNLQLFVHNEVWQDSAIHPDLTNYWQANVRTRWQ